MYRLYMFTCAHWKKSICNYIYGHIHTKQKLYTSDLFIFQGGPLIKEDSPVPFPERLNQLIRNAELLVSPNPHPSVSRWRPSWFSCVQGGSTSWELLRKETKLRLDHLDLLVAFIKDAASASRSRSTPTQHQH
uniref:Uncharacterized protein n=1 Tax=Mastacembelus armatus TaxID=205130 RepID=A0A7N8X4F6_9TELE